MKSKESTSASPLRAAVWIGLPLALLLIAGICAAQSPQVPPDMVTSEPYGAAQSRLGSKGITHWITASHADHPALQGNFTSGPEVTKACLTCHNKASLQFHETIHWTWLCPHDPEKKMGKYGVTFNNFCIAVPSNEPRCTSCHAGYGWKNDDYDFKKAENVDCLVCHEKTGTYKKFPTMAGNPVKEQKKFGKATFYPPDWNTVAQSVGLPDRRNCGVCHFYGGGGDGVKHGDLDSSLLRPSRDLDVHMNSEGANFSCTRCHTTEAHRIAGRCYKTPAATDRKSLIDDDSITRITCESCHTSTPHKDGIKANDHTDKVACQTCHIPTYARVLPTKMYWDWSTAGQKKDGKPYVLKDELGKQKYNTKKGSFVWKKNVEPEYYWFNGTLEYLTLEDTFDPETPTAVNMPIGGLHDANSRIYPFKVHRGKQPYDAGNNMFVVPHLFGKDKTAFWKGYDWNASIQAGMDYMHLPFSGEVGFAETSYVFPITHMVAPKEKSLACEACHADEGRMANLAGFYMPGRDHIAAVDGFGWFIVVASLIGVFLHGFFRVIIQKREG